MRQSIPFALCYILIISLFAVTSHAAETDASPVSENNSQLLTGKWLRQDGGYILEISDPADGGKLTAAYFNPRPVNVSRAAWRFGGGRLQVFIELTDTGYPGATYILHLDEENDQLIGEYTQPAAEQTFEVVFMRQSEEAESQ